MVAAAGEIGLAWPPRRIHARRRSPSRGCRGSSARSWPSTGRSAPRSARWNRRPGTRSGRTFRRSACRPPHWRSPAACVATTDTASPPSATAELMMPVITSTRSESTSFRVLARPTSGLPSVSSCSKFDLAAGHLAAGLLDGELHALELALAQHGKHAGGLHQHADLQRIGRKRRCRRLDQESRGESANDRQPHDDPPRNSLFVILSLAAYQSGAATAKPRRHAPPGHHGASRVCNSGNWCDHLARAALATRSGSMSSEFSLAWRGATIRYRRFGQGPALLFLRSEDSLAGFAGLHRCAGAGLRRHRSRSSGLSDLGHAGLAEGHRRRRLFLSRFPRAARSRARAPGRRFARRLDRGGDCRPHLRAHRLAST